ncbi:exodeoxyribonuclease VII large subunit [Methylocella sp. CPCC 101449]|uniref:exodeoxyribonuclease VII large subunit n=1 Tax=Methylocella sp. CPCC 101449 TaxID=2987531 RepID=UPI002890923D|nr:exodeoxyribonuclease VII large subunit [Methylocella sp. CPCC 101449]MDT2020249.1 exodeoxyribonuclease VII large subunit [Methylocella sp. CPCC 101449]
MAARAESQAKTPAPSNAAELTVSELSGALKRTIEDRFGYVKVRGEVSGWRGPHSSGHCYFSLKDEGARIDAVIWKGTYGRLRVKPEEGMEVIATGKITTWPGKSAYQIVVESIEPAGVGALLAQLEERRKRLAAEGLFDEARKQLLPFLPQVIGVVTSPTGAVIRDILHRLADRFPTRVLVWPVRVQGETSAAEVAAAIEGFNALPEGGALPRPDVIIVARGGGSLEDLWGFNEEIVVRAAAGSMIPLVSAVGHETDWTLIDHVADRRAPTPTAAAEMCVPVRSDLMAQIASLEGRMFGARARYFERRRSDLRSLARALPNAEDLLALPRQRLDRAAEILPTRLHQALNARHLRLGRLAGLLAKHSPQAELARRRAQFDALVHRHVALARPGLFTERRASDLRVKSDRLRAAMRYRLHNAVERIEAQRRRIEDFDRRLAQCARTVVPRRQEQLRSLSQLLSSFSYRNVLARGFALVRDASGTPVRSVATVGPGAVLDIELADGHVSAQAEGEAPPRPAKPSRAPPVKKDQGSLF